MYLILVVVNALYHLTEVPIILYMGCDIPSLILVLVTPVSCVVILGAWCVVKSERMVTGEYHYCCGGVGVAPQLSPI